MMHVGDRVTLAMDSHRPRRVHTVVRLDDDGAWLRAEFEDQTFCINPNAEHTPAHEDQGSLW